MIVSKKAIGLAVTFCCLSGMGYAQRISMKMQNVTVEQVMDALQKKSGYTFVFSEKDVNTDRIISVNASNQEVKDVVQQMFYGQQVTYTFAGKNIIIRAASEKDAARKTKKIKGTVVDTEGEPLIGANILVKGSNSGTVTDINGHFALDVPTQSSLIFSYIGYRDQVVKVGHQNNYSIVLKEDSKTLDELVVVGFGTQKKENLTGAVQAVKMDKVLGSRPVTSLGTALQGTIPGFTTSSSAIPGGENNWNIRGVNSITGGSPLILVDNVVFDNLNMLNPADIESVSVLKDASSAAIYGARASFGVVLITTKKAKRNERLTINYNNNFAFSTITNKMNPASPIDFIRTLKEGEYSSLWSGQNIDTYMELLEEYKADPSRYPKGYADVEGTKYFLHENDILGDMFETGFKQTHNISAQGGSDRIDYRLSLGYTDEDGVLVTNKDAFTRTNVSSYVNGNITDWLSTSLTMNYSHGKKIFPCTDPASPLSHIWFDNLPSYHPVGEMPYGETGEMYPVKTPENLVRYSGTSDVLSDNTRILSRTVLKPFRGFKAILEYSYQSNATDKESYVQSYKMHQGLTESILPSTATNPYTEERGSTKYTTINAFADYTASFNKVHNIYAMAGFNQEKSSYRFVKAQAFNMISTDLPSLNGSDGTSTPKVSDSYRDYALRSGFVRATYNYNHLYLLEFNGRYDLSSKFPKDYRGGFFPSVSAAWNIGKEKFMEKANSVLSTLKIRASYGNLGNQNIQPYSYLPTMNIFDAPWISGDIRPKTVSAPGMVRANFTWEKVESINGGIDFGFLNNQLTGSFDIYRRNTKGMLGPSEELPLVAGAGAPLQNAADLKSVGWELSMNWKDVIGAVSYELGFNLYDSRSHITKYKNDTGLIQNNLYRKGMEIGEIWGYLTDGFYTADDFDENGVLKEGVVSIRGVNSHEGDIKYKNLKDDENSVNIIDEGNHTENNPGDRVIIGNNRPRFQYGINGNLKWKGLGFSFLLQGVGKCDAWIGGTITFPMPDQWNTVYEHQVGKIWTKDNPNAFYGRIYENASSSQGANQRVSDKFLYNANYLRVKNLTLSYTFPRNWMQAMKIRNLTAFVSGENLFTFDHLPKGVDPETLRWTYPHSKTISFGINFNL